MLRGSRSFCRNQTARLLSRHKDNSFSQHKTLTNTRSRMQVCLRAQQVRHTKCRSRRLWKSGGRGSKKKTWPSLISYPRAVTTWIKWRRIRGSRKCTSKYPSQRAQLLRLSNGAWHRAQAKFKIKVLRSKKSRRPNVETIRNREWNSKRSSNGIDNLILSSL